MRRGFWEWHNSRIVACRNRGGSVLCNHFGSEMSSWANNLIASDNGENASEMGTLEYMAFPTLMKVRVEDSAATRL